MPWRKLKLMMRWGLPAGEIRMYDGTGHAFAFQPGLHFARDVSRFLLAD